MYKRQPDMSPEIARLRILNFINGVTGGRPSNNKDGGDWMAFMGVAAGADAAPRLAYLYHDIVFGKNSDER